jgi:hypothetical protein
MKQISLIAVVCCVLIVMLFSIASIIDIPKVAQFATVFISSQHRELTSCIASFSNDSVGEFEVQRTELNGDGIPDAIVHPRQGELCGSAGCVHELCVSNNSAFEYIPFGYAAESVSVKDTKTQNMHDLMLNNDPALTMVWSGNGYLLSY